MVRKESRQFNISVEGINCEKMYFEHIAKRNAHRPVEQRGSKKLPYIHVQDIEDFYDNSQKTKFYKVLDEMQTAEDKFGISYELGYSNYTFELWILLHVADMSHSVQNRYAYLSLINKYFNRSFTHIDDFKRADEFQRILDEFVTLDSVKSAIARAEMITAANEKDKKKREVYKGFSFCRDNPDITVHEAVKLIFDVCGVK